MDANSIAELLQSAAAAATVARLTRLKLGTRFRALLAWMIVLAFSELIFSLVSQASALYFWLYMAFVPVAVAFSIAAVRELLALVFEHYPGIRSLGRFGSYVGVAAAAVISVGAAAWLPQAGASGSRHLFYLEVLQRSVIFTLAVVILAVLYFLSRYPLQLSRNTMVSAIVFSALFLSDAIRLLVDSLQTLLASRAADWTESAFIVACLAAWSFLVRKEPEGSPAPARISFPSPGEEELLHQLDTLNNLLGRAARQ
jgi:hypothetical protein